MDEDLFLGFDLSTQQIKAVVINEELELVVESNVEFDVDTAEYGTKKGVFTNVELNEVYAPVAMWLKALDILLNKLKHSGLDFAKIKCISGAGQQHGSVYWSKEAASLLSSLNPAETLESQLAPAAFSHDMSPNWQDHSTTEECDFLENKVGGPMRAAEVTGSRFHHRFTGPQILRFRRQHPDRYLATARISLVSNFFASLWLGTFAPFDRSDVCGMNLWDISDEKWDEDLVKYVAGDSEAEKEELLNKLGHVEPDGGKSLGLISDYFVKRFGFSKDCSIVSVTGDNPSTILALPLRPLDVIVSFGTSTTLLISTPVYKPSPSYHLFTHPTSKGLYMGMLCYCNGSLAREQIRDGLNTAQNYSGSDPWELFNASVENTPCLGSFDTSKSKLGIYFPLPEIIPDCKSGTWRFLTDDTGELTDATDASWNIPLDDARAILESQNLSMRLRAEPMLSPSGQPHRVYVVGGGSKNLSFCKLLGQILGPADGVYRLELSNACALGSAYKALWSLRRKKILNEDSFESFDDFLADRWNESSMISKVDQGYQPEIWHRYGSVLNAFSKAEDLAINSSK
ncbi:uncharacterized protein V1516DRAFT_634238 [Lipomyces oligophaga]|uniref:uncharacterized protein n=1 Tax=Lipomyces oligophaga TaxID=45792 RepID=UPI0034CF022A